ncbi:MAG TPA: hypothetical protein VG900_04415 [Hyphomicrobiaceae bacterium]|nr:hypothetical protein [Hyphomicrobiaceae bacterium]
MSALPAAGYLAEFGPDGEVVARRSRGRGDASSPGNQNGGTGDAYAKGFEDGKAAVQSAFEVKVSEQKSRYEIQLASEREQWAAQQGARLAELLQAGLRDLEASIAEAAGRVLKPFLQEGVRRQAIADLQEALRAVLAGNEGAKFVVSGPDDLLEVLRRQLSEAGVSVAYEPSQHPDVRISVGETVLEARLGAWMAKIDEAVR